MNMNQNRKPLPLGHDPVRYDPLKEAQEKREAEAAQAPEIARLSLPVFLVEQIQELLRDMKVTAEREADHSSNEQRLVYPGHQSSVNNPKTPLSETLGQGEKKPPARGPSRMNFN